MAAKRLRPDEPFSESEPPRFRSGVVGSAPVNSANPPRVMR